MADDSASLAALSLLLGLEKPLARSALVKLRDIAAKGAIPDPGIEDTFRAAGITPEARRIVARKLASTFDMMIDADDCLTLKMRASSGVAA